MSNDIFSDVAKGLSAWGEESRELVHSVSAIPSDIALIRRELLSQEITKEVLDRVVQERKRLRDIHEAVKSYASSLKTP